MVSVSMTRPPYLFTEPLALNPSSPEHYYDLQMKASLLMTKEFIFLMQDGAEHVTHNSPWNYSLQQVLLPQFYR